MSRFLPTDFDSQKPIAVIAGKENYPFLTVERIRKVGLPIKLIAFEGETHAELYNSFPENDRAWIKVGQLGKLLKTLKKFNAGYAIMVGQITPRRLFKGLHPDFKAIRILTRLKERNAETIFTALGDEIEKIGVHLLDARTFLDDQLATEGSMTGGRVKLDTAWIEHGIRVAKEVARLDIGQGVVVRKGTVLAVEAFEGTDVMLQRAGTFGAKQMLFIKTVKPQQDYRFDVPVFGLKTVNVMAEAGIFYAGLEANNTIILNKAGVIAEAKKHGIHIFGYKGDSPAQIH